MTYIDIFLSPVKPPTKSSVSAEAINASLYYLHVATPEDDALIQEAEQQREEHLQRRREELDAAGVDDPSQREFARMNHVRRKPVGGAEGGHETAPAPALAQENTAPLLNNPPLPPRPQPMPRVSAENMSFPGSPVANAPPLPSPTYSLPDRSTESAPKSPIARRPLPPLPPTEEPFGGGAAGGEDQRNRPNRWSAFAEDDLLTPGQEQWRERYEALATGRYSLDSNRPPLPPRSTQPHTSQPPRSPGQSPSRNRKPPRQPSNAGFHITLIRRDPTSGTQWNVATISTPRSDHNAVDIDISTPGYNRFINSGESISLASLAANLPPGLVQTAGSSIPAPVSLPVNQPEQQPTGPRRFQRQLCVSKAFDESGASSSEFGNGHDNSKLKSGYYVFNSPWNGTCTFSSSVNGRSLKCKHMVQGPPGAFPPTGDTEPNPAVTVAEIRFNTPFQAANLHYHAASRANPNQPSPTSSNFPDSNTENTHTSKRGSLSQFLNPNTYSRPRAHSGPNTSDPAQQSDPNRQPFNPGALLRRTSLRAGHIAHNQTNRFGHHHFHRRNRSTSTSSGGQDSDEDRLDFSLARELAGGGMRGKSAKLGKLIIEDEGIKMLDLLVAACMAVWWRGYYL